MEGLSRESVVAVVELARKWALEDGAPDELVRYLEGLAEEGEAGIQKSLTVLSNLHLALVHLQTRLNALDDDMDDEIRRQKDAGWN